MATKISMHDPVLAGSVIKRLGRLAKLGAVIQDYGSRIRSKRNICGYTTLAKAITIMDSKEKAYYFVLPFIFPWWLEAVSVV
jgi:hypothetical protein